MTLNNLVNENMSTNWRVPENEEEKRYSLWNKELGISLS